MENLHSIMGTKYNLKVWLFILNFRRLFPKPLYLAYKKKTDSAIRPERLETSIGVILVSSSSP